MRNLLNKKDSFIIVFLVIVLLIFNTLIFGLQLDYGFRDVDWMSLYYYKLFGVFPLSNLIEVIKVNGVYTHQVYYVGFLEQIFGLNFKLLHLSSQIFKILAAMSFYFLTIVVFRNKLLAFLTSILYTISFTHAGPLFQLSTGSYFPGVIMMNLFLIGYWMLISEVKKLKWIIWANIFLLAAFLVVTERMYPLIPLIFLGEFFLVIYKKESLVSISKRLLYLFFPIFSIFLIYTIWFKSLAAVGFSPNQFFVGTDFRIKTIQNGNWQLLLYPFASFGSMFLHGEYWKYLGQVNTQSLTSYIFSLVFGPLLKLGILSLALLFFVVKRPLKYTAAILTTEFLFGMIIYWMFNNWMKLDTLYRIHFDLNQTVNPTLFGFFILAFTVIFFIEWKRTRNSALLPLIIGSIFSWMFIFFTWIPSDIQLLFIGPQRYLSFPSIGISLFISGILIIIFNNLRKRNSTRSFAWMVFLMLIPFFLINYRIANDFFNDELSHAGMRGVDQTIMKNSFKDLTPNISKQERSLFYFDETADKDNGYFDESTVLAGFEFWTKFNKDGELDDFPYPGMLRTNVQCPKHTHQDCIDIMREGLAIINGEKGIWYKDVIRGQTEPRFYKLSNFYALRFINKNLVDIRKEVIEELNITQ